MQAQSPLIPERRMKLTLEDRQAVPCPSVGDEAVAVAKNNQGVGKQKGTTLEAVRSPKPRVQPIAKNKVDVEQQKETVVPSKVPPPIKRKKAQGLGKGKEKAMSIGSQKPHEDICAQKMQHFEKPKETAMSLEAVGSQIIHENFAVEKMQGSEKGKIPLLIELSRMLLEEDRSAKLPKPKPTKKVQVPKEVKKPKPKDTSALPNLIKASEQPVKRKLPLQATTLGSPSKRAKVGSFGPLKSANSLLPPQQYIKLYIDGKLVRMCRADPACLSQNTKMEKQTQMMDHLRKQHGLNVAILDRVSGRVGEAKQDQKEAKDEGEEEESGKEEEKSICEEGEEEEDEGGDEEGVDDEKKGGEKAEEEGREGDEDGSDGEKTDKGDGSPRDDEDSKDDGEGSGDDGKGMRKGIVQKERMEVMKGTGLVLRLRRPRHHPARRAHPSRAGWQHT
ncbi:hypothetical protein L7F22_060870 [Adiantum nelumboides]|nr:hypothetical protein [Adiantum nelumboides]